MKNIELYTPSVNELWFRQECMSDSKTMSYNAGYDVSYDGYHYETGCIDFPNEKWEAWFQDKMKNPNFFYAYILDKDSNNFVGYVNFNLNPETKKATMGIVIKNEYRGQGYMKPAMLLLIQCATRKQVKSLTDTVPESRKHALKVFYDLGFNKMREFKSNKFGQEEIVAEIEKEL